jgi:hypothetical protein
MKAVLSTVEKSALHKIVVVRRDYSSVLLALSVLSKVPCGLHRQRRLRRF